MDMHGLRRVVAEWWSTGRTGCRKSIPDPGAVAWNPAETSVGGLTDAMSLDIQWLQQGESRRVLLYVADSWHTTNTDYTQLAEVQWEVWNAAQGLQPQPDIAIAWMECGDPEETYSAIPLGVLSGRPNYAAKYYYISNLALHPQLRATSANGATLWCNPAGKVVSEALIDAAIDVSHDLGNHGWVAVTPQPGDERGWNSLKFYYHDDFTYRRMGYFTS